MRLGYTMWTIWKKIGDRVAMTLVKGALASSGRGSILVRPFRLEGPEGIAIGRDVYIGANCWLQGRVVDAKSPSLHIGDRVSISGDCTISANLEVRIEPAALIARGVFICDHTHSVGKRAPIRDQGSTTPRQVVIGEGSWIGQGAIILPGVTIGAGAVVAANSVVRESVPPHSLVAGTPSRFVRTLLQ